MENNSMDNGKKPVGRPKNGRNKQRSCQEKVRLIEKYYVSGLGYRAFSEENDVAPSVFYSWLKKYEKDGIDGLRFQKKRTTRLDAQKRQIAELKKLIAEQQIEIQRLTNLVNRRRY